MSPSQCWKKINQRKALQSRQSKWLLEQRVPALTLTMFLFFFFFFLMWTILKVFIEFVTILLLFYVLVFWPHGMGDLTSPTRDWSHIHCIGWWSLNHWIAGVGPTKFWVNTLNWIFIDYFQFHFLHFKCVIGQWNSDILGLEGMLTFT